MTRKKYTLTEELNHLIDQRQANIIGSTAFNERKRRLLRLPSRRIPPILSGLLAGLVINGLMFAMVTVYPMTGRYFLGFALFLLVASHVVSRLTKEPGFAGEIERIKSWGSNLRRAVYLDVADNAVRYAGDKTAEVAALRYLRDVGELSKGEFAAGRAIVEDRVKPLRWIAVSAVILAVLNFMVLIKTTSVSFTNTL
ncbi:hypothetical protein BC777_3885 [Yoonia maricola]|uniref:Uncharacterized protein n=1 Tax=Yoonia maricola TaxID=420999 RepID=A0A2M8W095_9RHOB|nr:hypothetical protein [Yoonia maricola]PJI84343.1 hypothetical protein BC777_3885 [Yoonia maricola]